MCEGAGNQNRGHMGDLSRQIGDDAPQKIDFPPFALKLIFTMWHALSHSILQVMSFLKRNNLPDGVE
jgi:hypothetical protein